MLFYLGTHLPHWLGLTDVPLFISRRRIYRRKTLPEAKGPWVLDSGGFTELSEYGTWTVKPWVYAAEAKRFRDNIGNLQWAAIQDWMCEPSVRVKTGLSVREHQVRTIDSLLELRSMAPDLPWVPVLQGWRTAEYVEHVQMYREAGIELKEEKLVGVGSICRRTQDISLLLLQLHFEGLKRLHGFGVKGLTLVNLVELGQTFGLDYLVSADSMAWSFCARRDTFASAGDRNNLEYALAWRDELLAKIRMAKAEGGSSDVDDNHGERSLPAQGVLPFMRKEGGEEDRGSGPA